MSTMQSKIKQYADLAPHLSGVYLMMQADSLRPLYIGKAKDLNKRLMSYTQTNRFNPRINKMRSLIDKIEWIVTKSEAEAILLEANLIRKHKPRYNILLKDDKSFPYIKLSLCHDFPSITKFRSHQGLPSDDNKYYGPFVHKKDLEEMLAMLKKAFLIRSCSDGDFATRTRPCLLHQIKQCSAPCMKKITPQAYSDSVKNLQHFLNGKIRELSAQLSLQMDQASAALAFEEAAKLRDRIRLINSNIPIEIDGDIDIAVAIIDNGLFAINMSFYRGGKNYGNKSYYLELVDNEQDIISLAVRFLSDFYHKNHAPSILLVNFAVDDELCKLMIEEFNLQAVSNPKRGAKRMLLDRQINILQKEILSRKESQNTDDRLFTELAQVLDIPVINMIEIYDNSHISGDAMVGAMVAAGRGDGFIRNRYMRFNIKSDLTIAGDDYAMMKEVITRRIKRFKSDNDWPELVMIDGGKGHLHSVQQAIVASGVSVPLGKFHLLAISKGRDRNSGRERFFVNSGEEIVIEYSSPLIFLMQRLRDEAHRFAITSHRIKRSKLMTISTIDSIEGVGAARKKSLLKTFGSVAALREASITEIARVDGISQSLAKRIKDEL